MIILARHGETEWNRAGRLQGWKDSPLTVLGKKQAQSVAREISRLTWAEEVALESSPLGRAFDTARLIAAEIGIPVHDIQLNELLKEYSYGRWEGMTFEEVKNRFPSDWDSRVSNKWGYQIPGGESYDMMAKRALAWLEGLSFKGMKVAVSHQMIGRAIRGAYLGLDRNATMRLSQANNEIIVLEDGNEYSVVA